jgi:hypothetical protein
MSGYPTHKTLEVDPDRSAKADPISVIISALQAIATISNLRSPILAVILVSAGIPFLVTAAAPPPALKGEVCRTKRTLLRIACESIGGEDGK